MNDLTILQLLSMFHHLCEYATICIAPQKFSKILH